MEEPLSPPLARYRDQTLSTPRSFWLAGGAAIGAGLCWVSWVVLNAITGGGLDVGPPAISRGLARTGQALMVGWNVLLIPTALGLLRWLGVRRRGLLRLSTTCGILSMLLWAYGGATGAITSVFEATYLALSGIWWLGVGLVLRHERRALGLVTIVLGTFAVWDAAVVLLDPVPFWLLVSAAPKLPLSVIWDFWAGAALIERAMRHRSDYDAAVA